MFAAPPTLGTTIAARLPDDLRIEEEPAPWAAGLMLGRPIHSLLEGPCFAADGQFYCVDVIHGRIFRIDGDEFTVIADYDGEPNGLAAHPDGRIFIADYKNGIMTLDPSSGRIEPVMQRYRAERFKGVNDLTFSLSGDLYFTDQGLTGLQDQSGRVFRLSPGGDLQLLLDGIPSPNGLVLNHDESELFVGVTRDNAVWTLPLLRDGGVAKVGRFIQLSGGLGPDGLALDSDGNLFVAHVGLGSVWGFSRLGEPIARIRCETGIYCTNLAFGGENNRTLFITEAESGCILTADRDVPGAVLFGQTRPAA